MQQLDLSGYDVIISRGGTSELIRPLVQLPVVDIAITPYDVLKALRLAAGHHDRYAVVGYPNITESAYMVCRLLQYDVRIETIQRQEDTERVLEELIADGYHAVVCDAGAHTIARRRGMEAFLIVSGQESLQEALSQARISGRAYHEQKQQEQLTRDIFQNEGFHAAVLDAAGNVRVTVPEMPQEELLACLRAHLGDIGRGSGSLRFYYNSNDMLFSVVARRISYSGETAFLFSWQATQIPLRSGRLGIRFLDAVECEHLFGMSFYTVASIMGPLGEKVNALAASRQPVMIYGEPGTGKEQIARALYLRGRLTANPYVVVDCAILDDKSWTFLLSHYGSPLNSNDITVFFQHIDRIPDNCRLELQSVIQDTGLLRHKRFLFSCDCPTNAPMPDRIRELAEKLSCAMLYIPPLRTRGDELPAMANQYLKHLSAEAGKELAGL